MAAKADFTPLHDDGNRHKKLPRLPRDAKISKRPLIRPMIASPHASSSQQKVVYVSARTPFLSAVKRVEKLLRLSEKRVIQSVTANAQKGRGRRGKRSREEGENQIGEIAAEVERRKTAGRKRRLSSMMNEGEGDDASPMEEVAIKGTGKAITKVMEMALWFQERSDVYRTHIRTDSVSAIDDVDFPEKETPEEEGQEGMVDSPPALPETRVRYTSVLEVRISLC